MNGPMTPERAHDLLEAQLEELGALRNAHARDPRFKQWRQTTLTVIQRIWPGDTTRAERFRRVPFSPPSNKTSQKAARSFFEKGCAEAVHLIRSMIPELGSTQRPTRAELAAPAPGEIEDDFPVVDLPGTGSGGSVADDAPEVDDTIDIPRAPAPPPAPAPKSKSESRRPLPPGTRTRDEAPEAPAVPKAPSQDGGKVSMRSSAPTSESRPPLREMLGFSSQPLDDDDDADAPSEREDFVAYDDDIEATPTHSEWQVDEIEEIESIEADAEGWEAPEEFQLPARSRGRNEVSDPIIETDPENFPPAEPAAGESDEPVEATEEDDGNVMEEFLRTSPVLKASARPVRRRDSESAAAPSPAAASLVALASEVARLGVPEGQRAGMRATLIELARHVDDQSLDWDTLRESFHAVLDYPPLARRVIPLLIPYLDAAA